MRVRFFQIVWPMPFGTEPRSGGSPEKAVRADGGANAGDVEALPAPLVAFGNFLAHEVHVWRPASLAFDEGQIPPRLGGGRGSRSANPKINLLRRSRIPSRLTVSPFMNSIIRNLSIPAITLALAVWLAACSKKEAT